jgi:hypothetical protein
MQTLSTILSFFLGMQSEERILAEILFSASISPRRSPVPRQEGISSIVGRKRIVGTQMEPNPTSYIQLIDDII